MTKVPARCQHHPDVIIPDKFSLCRACAREFFQRYGIPYDAPVEDIEEIQLSDIIIELDEILLREDKKRPCLSSSDQPSSSGSPCTTPGITSASGSGSST